MMRDIVEAWLWGDPGGVLIERLMARSARTERRGELLLVRPPRQPRDRYYTQARRLHVKQLMKGRL